MAGALWKINRDLVFINCLEEAKSVRPSIFLAGRMPHQPADYRKLRADPAFRADMVAATHKWNAESRNGW